MHPTTRYLRILFALVVAIPVPGLAQGGAIRRNHFSVDVGLLQGGLAYARRVGHGPFSIGGGVWGAWEPWTSFEGSVFQPLGAELFVRAHLRAPCSWSWGRRCFVIAGQTIARSAPGLSPEYARRPWWARGSSHWVLRSDSAGASRRGCCFPGGSRDERHVAIVLGSS